jgi:hypothetical protein
MRAETGRSSLFLDAFGFSVLVLWSFVLVCFLDLALLEGLEDEHDEIARTVRVAKAAEPELQRMAGDAASRRARAVDKLRRAEASEVRRRLRAVEATRDELADELRGVLAEHGQILGEYVDAIRQYSDDDANAVESRRAMLYSNWFRGKFSKWLR